MTSLHVNGRRRSFHGDRETPLLWALRDELGLTGTKYGCGTGACGACTVLLDGKPARSCMVPVARAGTAAITTIEGARGREAEAVIAAWQALDVVQCGYCQSGQVMSAIALLSQVRDPSDAVIDAAMAGNLCRCCTYVRVRAAIHRAAAALKA
jgi:isoquinoline 1-oxidoreductase alpha subunit